VFFSVIQIVFAQNWIRLNLFLRFLDDDPYAEVGLHGTSVEVRDLQKS